MSIRSTSRKYAAFGLMISSLAKMINKWNISYINGYIVNTHAALKIENTRLKNQREFLKIAQESNKILQGDLDVEERKLKIEERKLNIIERRRKLSLDAPAFTAAAYDEPGNIREENRSK
jgi:hypothetical protein